MPAQSERLRLPAAAPMPRGAHALYGLLALLGASVVVWSVAGKPPAAHAGHALAGFLLWLLGMIALLLSPYAAQPLFPVATTANLAVEKLKHRFSNPRTPAQAQAPALA
ncbi:Os05g0552000 [Oryza sativa Japonica Group]|jgi:hypothetical protein|uniref:Os05g0552000 protein n=3 Tax=Oryza TaxID=4527 RepID=C7J259_ORYSJ|nr:uncharacterized protein LOC9269116 [Oryza sativa Japonica Group]EEE64612.1 hypothetical protein OsJ_19464 [Oryza sativa Japonica Group]BAH93243.1 Os05g0552000 [Oryza sativa Japonica Group]BAS95223.1 Os05g0552000 [Oryza sativa Japonica Group]|eukprot:NP_001174515.1 Os05g0552000 [Oryza sativa Japonica Group]